MEGVWTQPVPAWGSPVRLDLPVPLASIVLGPGGGFGAFGAHQANHVEGLNHLVDGNRSDGERSDTGSPVSPFDYLRDEVREQVIAAHRASVVAPFFEQGLAAGNSRPWEPHLTNRMLFHQDHPGTLDRHLSAGRRPSPWAAIGRCHSQTCRTFHFPR